MSVSNHKIRVLIIDDKPGYAYRTADTFNHVPVIYDDSNRNSIPELNTEFELMWLQSPEDTKEYRDFCLQYEERFGIKALGESGCVPEIICFDYALSHERNKQILKSALQLFPNIKLGNKLGKGSYRIDNTVKIKAPEINEHLPGLSDKDKEKLKEIGFDNMGCFSGGLIFSLFRNYPCSPIPTTRKWFTHITGTHTGYFEWLLKDEFYEAFDLKGREIRWSELVPIAITNLKKQIKLLVKNKNITLSLGELNILLNDRTDTDPSMKGVFTFYSNYGKRELSLAGLMIDEKPENKEAALKIFIKELLEIITQNQSEEITEAKKKYIHLWDSYKSNFLNRILLSDFSTRKSTLNSEYKKLYGQLCKDYLVNKANEITKNLTSLNLLFTGRKRKKKVDVIVLRLVVLFLATRLWIEHKKSFNICSNIISNSSNIQLTKEDYYYLMNPVVNTNTGTNPLLLIMHSNIEESVYTDTFDKWLSDHGNGIPRANWHEFNWISDGEKIIVKSFFVDDLQSYGTPKWLESLANLNELI